MFSKFVSSVLLASTLIAGVWSTPIPNKELSTRTISFNSWGGHASLSNFDNFYGVDNFSNSHFSQVVVQHQQQLVCHAQQIQIIQQRLVVLQEMAKKIITEQICEVETQTIVFEQFHASLGSFSHDLRRISGRRVGYDNAVVSHFGSLVNSDGTITNNDLGFTGHDIGSNTVVVDGSNWSDSSSPISVGAAHDAARSAVETFD